MVSTYIFLMYCSKTFDLDIHAKMYHNETNRNVFSYQSLIFAKWIYDNDRQKSNANTSSREWYHVEWLFTVDFTQTSCLAPLTLVSMTSHLSQLLKHAVNQHWHVQGSDPQIGCAFQDPPVFCYRRASKLKGRWFKFTPTSCSRRDFRG